MPYLICYRNGDECQGNGEIYSRHETLVEAKEAFNQLEEGYAENNWHAGYKSASFILREADNGCLYDINTDECVGDVYNF